MPTLHMSLLELAITGAFAVGGVELVTTVLDTVFVSAFTSVIVATNVKKKRIVKSSFTTYHIRRHNIHT